MVGFVAYVKQIFFGLSSQNLTAAHQVAGNDSDKELLLDPSTGPVIHIPVGLRTPKPREFWEGIHTKQQLNDSRKDDLVQGVSPSERYEKPRKYWTLYYEAESHYKLGRYDLAKSELVALETISTLHPASRVLRLRTYRKLITKEKKKKVVSENAIALCEEMFASCVDDITDTDRRTYNQLLERLPTSSSLAGTPKLSLVSKMDAPDFEVVDQAEERVKNVLVCEIPAKEVRGRGKWNFAEAVPSGIVYGKRDYDSQSSRYYRTSLALVASPTQQAENWTIDADVRRLLTAEKADIVATIAASLELSTWTPAGQRLASRSIRGFMETLNEFKSFAVSPDGEYIVVSVADRVWVLDSALSVVRRVPLKEGWIKEEGTPTEDPRRVQIQEDLATLNLTGTVPQDELRQAFRQLILQYHPDRNPDSDEATGKTVALIEAYERLSGEDIELALAGLGLSEKYHQPGPVTKFEVPALGIEIGFQVSLGGDGRDWIYASYLSDRAEQIYLGTYAGQVYCVSNEGRVLKTFNIGEPVMMVREARGNLWIQGFATVYVFQGERLIRHLPLPTGSRTAWGPNGFCISRDKEATLFTSLGEAAGRILFKRPISTTIWSDDSLVIETNNRCFVFSIDASTTGSTPDSKVVLQL